jgi:hypothetical protein
VLLALAQGVGVRVRVRVEGPVKALEVVLMPVGGGEREGMGVGLGTGEALGLEEVEGEAAAEGEGVPAWEKVEERVREGVDREEADEDTLRHRHRHPLARQCCRDKAGVPEASAVSGAVAGAETVRVWVGESLLEKVGVPPLLLLALELGQALALAVAAPLPLPQPPLPLALPVALTLARPLLLARQCQRQWRWQRHSARLWDFHVWIGGQQHSQRHIVHQQQCLHGTHCLLHCQRAHHAHCLSQ